MNIDPGTISYVQTVFLQHINDAFNLVAHYAINLLYIFVVLEVCIAGFAWAMQQEADWSSAFFKIIKIGLIFFIIQNYGYLLDVIIRSFSQIGGVVANTPGLNKIIFNPAAIWQYGYDYGVQLLNLASNNSSVGFSLIQVLLGIGILMVFGLLGIQIILQIVGFYLTAMVSLIFLPFGAFQPSSNLFENSVRSVLKAGVKVMVLIMVIGIAVTVWNASDLLQLSITYNINEPLGLFFTALLFLYLAIYLPKAASETVGQISLSKWVSSVPMATVISSSQGQAVSSAPRELESIQAASIITPDMSASTSIPSMSSASYLEPQIQGAVSSVSSPSGQTIMSSQPSYQNGKNHLTSISTLQKSISDATVKKLKKTFMELLAEKEMNGKE